MWGPFKAVERHAIVTGRGWPLNGSESIAASICASRITWRAVWNPDRLVNVLAYPGH